MVKALLSVQKVWGSRPGPHKMNRKLREMHEVLNKPGIISSFAIWQG